MTNTGTVSLDTLVINDPKVGTVNCPSTSLAPGASITCTASYEINQPDVDAGQVVNEATATANDNSGAAVTSNKSTKTVPMSALAQISLKKTAAAPKDANGDNKINAGDTVDYTFEVKNTGDVSIDGSTVTDPLIPTLTCPPGILAPGQSKVCRATYTITQADVDAGKVVNTASAKGTDPKSNTVTATDSATVTIPAESSLDLIKTASLPRLAPGQTKLGAGSLVDYSFKVTNESNVTVTGVVISDDTLKAPITCDKTTLTPGESATCTGTYTLTTEDYDLGLVLNIAEAKAKTPAGDEVVSWIDSALVELKQEPSMSMKKTAGTIEHQPGSDKLQAGDTIKYTFVVKNTGNTTLFLVGVRDSLVGTVKCPVATLAPDASTTCEATYSITQADIDRGTLVNTANGVAVPPFGDEITSPDGTATVITKGESGLSLTKQATAPKDSNNNGKIDAGDSVDYTFTLTNTGQVTLKDLSVTDNKVSAVTCPTGTLAPGAAVVCTATRVLSQADVDAGKVDNVATGGSTNAYAETITSNESTATVAIPQQSALTIKKSAGGWVDANGNGRMDPGEKIPYSFVVSNAGTTTVTSIKVNDALISDIACDKSTLAPGEVANCSGSYTLSQADVDRGDVKNSATATGVTPGGGSTTSPGSDVDVIIPQLAKLDFKKTAGDIEHTSGNPPTRAGDTITYTFVVKNSGNVSVDFLQVNDSKAGQIDCAQDVLKAGESMTCTKVYTITTADMDAGVVENRAVAEGEDPAGKPVTSDPSTTTTNVDPTTELVLKKTAAAPKDVNGNGLIDAGDTIDYSFAVTNKGTVTMSTLKINDAKLPGSAISCPATSVAAGETVTCTGTYTISQADVDANTADNVATASAIAPRATDPVISAESGTQTPIVGKSALTIVKDGADPKDVNANNLVDAGDTIDYTFTVTNTGTTTLRTLVINDPLTPSANIVCDVLELAPKAVATCKGSYTVSQTDADHGKVVNTATATGTPDKGDPTTSPGAEKITDIPAVDKLAIAKSVVKDNGKDYRDANNNGRPDVGEIISYQFVVTNTGNTTSHNVRVDDAKVANVSCPQTELVAGASTTCTATYAITQADIDHGSVENTASVTGTPPGDRPDAKADSNKVVTPLERSNSLTLTKTVSGVEDVNNNQRVDVSDIISYTFTVTNNGNSTVKQISIQDAKIPTVNCEKTELAPGESAKCTGSYTISQAEVDKGLVSNTATSTGTGSDGKTTTSQPATAEQKTSTVASMSLVKTVDPKAPKAAKAGDKIAYIFTIKNTGALTITDPAVAEDLPGVTVSCPTGAILPGNSVDCTGSYTVTQQDVNKGQVINRASATGTAPVPGKDETQLVGSDPASVTESILRNSQLNLDKTVAQIIDVNRNGKRDAGDQIVYRIIATNAGNTTLTEVRVLDKLLPDLDCTSPSLVPGATLECDASATVYTITQADVDNGVVINEASGSAKDPDGVEVKSGTKSVTTPTASDAALSLQKKHETPNDANKNGQIDAGETVKFVFTVTNTGSLTVNGISITDPKLDAAAQCESTSLTPGQSMTCTGIYTFKQQDISDGQLENKATAKGDKAGGGEVTSPETGDVVTIDRKAVLAFEKSIDGTKDLNNGGRFAAGDQIDYRFSIQNTGNVAVTAAKVIDEKLAKAGVVISCSSGDLAPGQSIDCSASYLISQADANDGVATNEATAQGQYQGKPVDSNKSATTQQLSLVDQVTVNKKVGKTTDVNGNGKLDAGDTIEYQFVVTNSGTRDATGVAVHDPKAKVSCPSSTVVAGTSMTCTAIYTISQTDVDGGSVQNTATITGTTPDGKPIVSPPDSVTTALGASPAIKLIKQAGAVVDANNNGRKDAGDTIGYSFTVTNTGNTTLFAVFVKDPKLTAAGVVVNCPVSQLTPGQSTTCSSAAYTVSAADVEAGAVANVATANANSGSVSGGSLSSGPASVKSALDPKPEPGTGPLPETGLSNIWLIGLGVLVVVIGGILLFFVGRRGKGKDQS